MDLLVQGPQLDLPALAQGLVLHPLRHADWEQVDTLKFDGYPHVRDEDGTCGTCGAGKHENHYRCVPKVVEETAEQRKALGRTDACYERHILAPGVHQDVPHLHGEQS